MTAITVQGVAVPAIGLGTWDLRGQVCVDAVTDALAMGYRHLDTAEMYANEAEVGRGLAASTVPRDEVFVVTKVQPKDLAPTRVDAVVEASLRALGTWIDLLLIHWPAPRMDLAATLGAMQGWVDRGDVRHLGVSNFDRDLVDEARRHAPILANQVELHPYLPQNELVAHGVATDHTVTAYSPLAEGRVIDDPVLREVAAGHGATTAQVALAWALAKPGVGVIPRSSSTQRRAENLAAGDLMLTADEIAAVDTLSRS